MMIQIGDTKSVTLTPLINSWGLILCVAEPHNNITVLMSTRESLSVCGILCLPQHHHVRQHCMGFAFILAHCKTMLSSVIFRHTAAAAVHFELVTL